MIDTLRAQSVKSAAGLRTILIAGEQTKQVKVTIDPAPALRDKIATIAESNPVLLKFR